MRPSLFVASALVGLCLAAGTSTAQAMSCGGRNVQMGDSPSRVRELCGEPTEVTASVESRSRTVHRRVADGTVVSDTVTFTVQLERWVYDFGPDRFVRELIFEDGRLVRIDTGSYGTVRGRAPPE